MLHRRGGTNSSASSPMPKPHSPVLCEGRWGVGVGLGVGRASPGWDVGECLPKCGISPTGSQGLARVKACRQESGAESRVHSRFQAYNMSQILYQFWYPHSTHVTASPCMAMAMCMWFLCRHVRVLLSTM